MTPHPGNGRLPDPSDEQWEAIRRCDEHLLVAASAGTGKTFTVVRKLLYLMGAEVRGQVVAQPLRLRDLAAITYTNKAAAELKDKLRSGLRAIGRRNEAYEVDTARVGTIHAFCGDVLREFALRSGRSPSLSLVDDAESRRMSAECVRRTLLECIEDGSVPGLVDLLAGRSVADVEHWVGELLGHGDHLRVLATRHAAFGAAERVVVALAERTRHALEEQLVSAGAMDFDRMITWTRDLLRDDAVVRKALQRRVKVLFVDEFQDVDPVQKEIAWLLGEPASRRTDTTRLVLVGDPKQSIYRFRKADVTVWRGVQEQFERSKSGVVVALSRSRRSVPAVLGLVDHVVGALLDTPVSGDALQAFEVPHAPVTSERTDAPAHAGVELLCVAPTDGGKACTAEIVRATEAAGIARRVRALHEERGVPWGEIALLLTGWGGLDTYVSALRHAGIPTYALRGEGFWDRREVVDLLVALEALRNPNDRRWLFGFLRGPMVGLADESLLALRRARSDTWFRRADLVLADPVQHDRWRRGVALLERWAALRDRVCVAELLEEILAETGYCAHLALLGTEEARQRIGNVRKLVRIAAGMPEATVGDFLADVADRRALEVREGDARLHGEGDDVVTVSSVHSAKGLEWSVVFWCDLIRKPSDDHSRLLVGREEILLGNDVGKEEQSPEWQELHARLKRERQAEARRLWYVAATRAKDLLVLSGIALAAPAEQKSKAKPDAAEKGDGSVSDVLRARFPELLSSATVRFAARGGETFTAAVTLLPPLSDEAGASEPPPLADPDTLAAPHAKLSVERGSQRSSATQLMARERCGQRHWLKYELGVKEPTPVLGSVGDPAPSGGLTAIERGLVVHDVMERWASEADVAELIDQALVRTVGDAPQDLGEARQRARRDIEAEVAALVERPEVRSLLDHPAGRRELAFLALEPNGMAFEGAIDLVAPSGGGYDIVDVKTSRCSPEQAVVKAAGYARQRDLYAAVVEGITGAPVRRFSFAFSGAGVVIDSPPHGGVPHAPPSVQMAGDPAECRFCGYRSAGWCAGVPVEAEPVLA